MAFQSMNVDRENMKLSHSKISVAIVEDHALFRDILSKTVPVKSAQGEIEVVFKAGSGREMIEQLEIHQPDVILMDLKMPEMDGIQATIYVKKRHPKIKVIVLSMFDEKRFVVELVKCGANGFLTKNTSLGVIWQAIHSVVTRGYFYNDLLSEAAVESWRTKKHTRPSLNDPYNLTKREKQVLAMICDGCKTVEIASQLNIGARTIEGYRSELLSKTGAKNTANLVRYAVEHNLIALDLRKR